MRPVTAAEPLHICRGHFAHYAKDGAGLFGRGTYGAFWVAAAGTVGESKRQGLPTPADGITEVMVGLVNPEQRTAWALCLADLIEMRRERIAA